MDFLHVALQYVVVLKRFRERACNASAIDVGAIRVTGACRAHGAAPHHDHLDGREVEASLRIIEGMLEE